MVKAMKRILFTLGTGFIFGLGLMLSGMAQPQKVIGFLDLRGDWDPSLAFVMMGAIAVHFLAYRVVARVPKPFWGGAWVLPTRRDVNGRLLLGAALFGAGWGLEGYCPGPALTTVSSGMGAAVFTLSMLVGMGLYAFILEKK